MNETPHNATAQDAPAGRMTRAAWSFAYMLLGLPLSVAALMMGAVGRGHTAMCWEARLSFRATGHRLRHDPRRGGVVEHVVRTLPGAIVGAILSSFAVWLLAINVGFPARSGFTWWDRLHLFSVSANAADSWGGPTLAGAWAVHAAGALVIAAVLSWPLLWLAQARARSAARSFPPGPAARTPQRIGHVDGS